MAHFRGHAIDPVSLWSEYVEFPAHMDEDAEFSPLVFCPNPNHLNTGSPAFQINLRKPLVHCFASCGISGSYENAIAMVEGGSNRQARKTPQARISGRDRPVPVSDNQLRLFQPWHLSTNGSYLKQP
jgi:hypothetical protein